MKTAVAFVFAAAGSAFAGPVAARQDSKECIISAGSTHSITFSCGIYYNAADESEIFKERGDLEKVMIDCQDQQVFIQGRPEDSDVEDESTEWNDVFSQPNTWKNFDEMFEFDKGYVTGYMCLDAPKGPI